MPNKTTNYNLTKPLGNETVDISQLNENFDIIDSKMFENETRVDELNSNLETLEYGKVAGDKQLHDGKIYHFYQNVASPSVCDAYDNADSIIFETADLPDIITVNADNSNRNVVCYYDTFPAAGVSSVTNITEVTSGMPKNITVDKTHKYILIQLSYGQHVSNVMVNEGNISVPYEPYIPSVKMLADEVKEQNDSLSDYGFDNKFDGEYKQGAYSTANGTWQDLGSAISNTNKIYCKSGDIIDLKYSSSIRYLFIEFFNGNDEFISSKVADNASVLRETAPENTSYIRFGMQVANGTLTPDTAGKTIVYVNNAIDELKNDLIVLETTSTIDMTASRELDDITSSALTIPSGYKPIAMYGYNSDNNDNISAMPLLIRSDGKVLFHAKNHSTSDQGIIHFVVRVTLKKLS